MKDETEPKQATGINFMKTFQASTLATIVSMILLYPLDTVRKCIQMNASIGNADIYKSSIDCFKNIYQYDGVKGFYRGLSPCILRKIPSMALGFTLFEYFSSFYIVNKIKPAKSS